MHLLDRWWSSLGASLSCVVGSMLSERVGSMDARMHYVCVSLVQNAACTSCESVGKCEKGFVWSERREIPSDVRETQGCMATPTRKCKYEEVRWSLSRSSLAVCCVGVSAFRFPVVGVLSLVAISTTHCTVHMSVAWQCGSVGTCNISVSHEWDGHGRLVGQSVGRCMWSRRPR